MSNSMQEVVHYENPETLRERVHSAVSNLSVAKERTWTSDEIDKMIDTCFEEILLLYGEDTAENSNNSAAPPPSNDQDQGQEQEPQQQSEQQEMNSSPVPSVSPKSNRNLDKIYEYVVKSVLHMDQRVSSLEKHMEHAFQIILKLEKLHAHNITLNLNEFKSMLKDMGTGSQKLVSEQQPDTATFSVVSQTTTGYEVEEQQQQQQPSLVLETTHTQEWQQTTTYETDQTEISHGGKVQFLTNQPPYQPIALKHQLVPADINQRRHKKRPHTDHEEQQGEATESSTNKSTEAETSNKDNSLKRSSKTKSKHKKSKTSHSHTQQQAEQQQQQSHANASTTTSKQEQHRQHKIEISEGVIVLNDTKPAEATIEPIDPLPKHPYNFIVNKKIKYQWNTTFYPNLNLNSSQTQPKIRTKKVSSKKKYISLEGSRRELEHLQRSSLFPNGLQRSESFYELQQNYVNDNLLNKSEHTLELKRRREYNPMLHTSFIFPHAMVLRPRPVSYFINLTPDAVKAHLEYKAKRLTKGSRDAKKANRAAKTAKDDVTKTSNAAKADKAAKNDVTKAAARAEKTAKNDVSKAERNAKNAKNDVTKTAQAHSAAHRQIKH